MIMIYDLITNLGLLGFLNLAVFILGIWGFISFTICIKYQYFVRDFVAWIFHSSLYILVGVRISSLPKIKIKDTNGFF